MRFSDLLAITATLSLAVLVAGCNFGRKKGPGGPGTGFDGGFGVGTGLGANIDGEDYTFSLPFDQDPNRTPVSDAETGLEVVYFAFDSSTLAPSELFKIERAAGYLRSNPRHVMIVEGHCDERGSAEYNLSLGEFRAQAVRSYLISLGIEGNRLQTRSFGFEKPAVIGSGEAVWAQNRRAVFAVYK